MNPTIVAAVYGRIAANAKRLMSGFISRDEAAQSWSYDDFASESAVQLHADTLHHVVACMHDQSSDLHVPGTFKDMIRMATMM